MSNDLNIAVMSGFQSGSAMIDRNTDSLAWVIRRWITRYKIVLGKKWRICGHYHLLCLRRVCPQSHQNAFLLVCPHDATIPTEEAIWPQYLHVSSISAWVAFVPFSLVILNKRHNKWREWLWMFDNTNRLLMQTDQTVVRVWKTYAFFWSFCPRINMKVVKGM